MGLVPYTGDPRGLVFAKGGVYDRPWTGSGGCDGPRLLTLLLSWHIWRHLRSWVPSPEEAMTPARSFLPSLGENQPKSEHKKKQTGGRQAG